jgi:transcriptional regulator with XRE-family HTH domain
VTEELSTAVAEEIRRLLDERGMSGRELARLTEIPQRTVAAKLAGRNPFDLDDVAVICRVLEVSVTDLLGWAQRG